MMELDGWSWRLVHDGAVLAGPGGATGRVWQRQRPLRPTTGLVRDHIARHAQLDLVDVTHAPFERISTNEGGYAALTKITGRQRDTGDTVSLDLAFIFGDDFYDLVELQGSEVAATVRAMAFAYQLGIDSTRPRRFLYTPPPRWQGLARGLVTEWFPPEFPTDWAQMAVSPALVGYRAPSSLVELAQHHAAMIGFVPDEQFVKEEIVTKSGLYGTLFVGPGHYRGDIAVTKIAVALDDNRSCWYAARLEVRKGNPNFNAYAELFKDLVKSIVPLPVKSEREPELFVPWRG